MVRIHDKEGRFKFRLPPNAEKVDRYYDGFKETHVTTMLDEFGLTYEILDSDKEVYERGEFNPTVRYYGGTSSREDLEDSLKKWVKEVRRKRKQERGFLGSIINILTYRFDNSQTRTVYHNVGVGLKGKVPNIEDYTDKSLDGIPLEDRKIIEKELRRCF